MSERDQRREGTAEGSRHDILDGPDADRDGRAVAHPAETGAMRRRLMPRPEKGLSFDEAVDKSMREHRAVYAALAK